MPFTVDERNKKIAKFQKEQMDLLNRKGRDYTGGKLSQDGNANFKEIAHRLQGAPLDELTVWAIFFEKGIMAIETWIRTRVVESEGMESRFNDAANYSNIGRTLYEESILLEEAEEIERV